MKNLKIYIINEEYINYLRKYDSKVPYNKSKRPFVGVVYEYNHHNYFAPLSSPKPKHLKMNANALDIFKIKEGTLGIVNINNMIPVPKFVLTELLPLVKEAKYKELIKNQLTFLNKNKAKLMKKVTVYYNLYNKNLLSFNQNNRTCNYHLLEEKCDEYH